MQWSDLPRNPPARTLRQFAVGLLVFLVALACWQEFTHHNRFAAFMLAAVGLLAGSAGLVYPRLLRPVFVGWMVLAFPIGWAVSQATLAVLFYGLFTPIGLVFRLFGRDVLVRRRRADYDSYWQVKPAAQDARTYFRQS